MNVNELMEKLRAETTGDLSEDLRHLQQTVNDIRREDNASELAEAVAEYAFSLMPEDKRAEMQAQTFVNGKRMDRVFAEAQELIRARQHEKAEPLLAALSEKIERYYEKSDIRYFSFRNPFEYHVYVQLHPEEKHYMRAPFDFAAYLSMYGYVLVHLRKTEEAEKVLLRAVEMNPVTADTRFELAELYKLTSQPDQLLRVNQESLPLCTTADRIARVLANMGFYCYEVGDFYSSAVFYFDSVRFLPNEQAEAALKDVVRRLNTFGQKFAPPTHGQTIDTYEKYGLQPPPDNMLVNLAVALAKSAREHNRPELEGLFTRTAFDLTNDPAFKARLDELDAQLAAKG